MPLIEIIDPIYEAYNIEKYDDEYILVSRLMACPEMRRLTYLKQANISYFHFPGATHNRYAHAFGSYILARIARSTIRVKEKGKFKKLGDWLKKNDYELEFALALFLHDLGHLPFAHVLEKSGIIEEDHERITEGMLSGGEWYIKLKRFLVEQKLHSGLREEKKLLYSPFEIKFILADCNIECQTVHDVLKEYYTAKYLAKYIVDNLDKINLKLFDPDTDSVTRQDLVNLPPNSLFVRQLQGKSIPEERNNAREALKAIKNNINNLGYEDLQDLETTLRQLIFDILYYYESKEKLFSLLYGGLLRARRIVLNEKYGVILDADTLRVKEVRDHEKNKYGGILDLIKDNVKIKGGKNGKEIRLDKWINKKIDTLIALFGRKKFLFRWEYVPENEKGNDSEKLKNFLSDDLGITWVADRQIEINEERNNIKFSKNENESLSLVFNDQENIVTLNTDEAVPQFKISTKRRPNRALYRKISIHFRKISNYGTSSDDKKTCEFFVKKVKEEKEKYHDIYGIYGNIIDEFTDKPNLHVLSKLISGSLDLDRLDHYQRDSVYTGIKLAEFNLISFLSNIIINFEKKSILISEEGATNILKSFDSRDLIVRKLWNNPNIRFYETLLKEAVKEATEIKPSLKLILPFVTDDILLKILTVDMPPRVTNMVDIITERKQISPDRFTIIEDYREGWDEEEESKIKRGEEITEILKTKSKNMREKEIDRIVDKLGGEQDLLNQILITKIKGGSNEGIENLTKEIENLGDQLDLEVLKFIGDNNKRVIFNYFGKYFDFNDNKILLGKSVREKILEITKQKIEEQVFPFKQIPAEDGLYELSRGGAEGVNIKIIKVGKKEAEEKKIQELFPKRILNTWWTIRDCYSPELLYLYRK